jgi:hypothetical protein
MTVSELIRELIRAHVDRDPQLLSGHETDRRVLIIITTMNDLPGYRIDGVIGEVFDLTVRWRRSLRLTLGAGTTFVCMLGRYGYG